jgi:hypothetical protein
MRSDRASGVAAVIAAVVVVFVSGCAGVQSPVGAMAPPQGGARTPALRGKVRARSSSHGDLLYIGSQEYGVFVLSYPQGQIVTQFEAPNDGVVFGMCSDQSGDVFVLTGGTPGYIYEYAHGGASPIATLQDGYDLPLACAVDPTTGNLAVVNNDVGTVAIFPDAQDPPIYYNDPNMHKFDYCAYDDSGDLFVDGFKTGSGNIAMLAELPYGSSSFTDITPSEKLGAPGSMQWLGTYLAVGSSKQVVWHIEISGSSGMIVGKTNHKRLKNPWTIDGKQLISVYGNREARSGPFKVAYWAYPKGGAPTQLFNLFGSNSSLDGVAVSLVSESRR